MLRVHRHGYNSQDARRSTQAELMMILSDIKETLELCDDLLGELRKEWLETPVPGKPRIMQRIDGILDRRLKVMRRRDGKGAAA